MKLIETKTLGTAAASIEFTSIPQTFTDLVVLVSARATTSSETRLALNGVTTNFTRRDLVGTGSTVFSTAGNDNFLAEMGKNPFTANTFGNLSLYIPNYTVTGSKSYSVDAVNENNGTEAGMRILAGLSTNTAAITSLTISAGSGDTMIAHSTVSLYGITKGSDGIVTTS
jgi:hypothetical protein